MNAAVELTLKKCTTQSPRTPKFGGAGRGEGETTLK